MTEDIRTAIAAVITLVVNYATFFMIFPRRYNRLITVGVPVIFTVIFHAILLSTGTMASTFVSFRGLIHLPLILLLMRGQFFQKLFAVLLVMLSTGVQLSIVDKIAVFFYPTWSREYYTCFFIILFPMYAVYYFLMLKHGNRLFQKMFINGRILEWALYSFGAAFSLGMLVYFQQTSTDMWMVTIVLLFIIWSFAVLCFAIINTHEKSKQKSDAEFAQSIVSSGHDHYRKMGEMYDKLRIMRHDYKYHLNVVRKMLSSGCFEEADQYLTDVECQLSENELRVYCSNTVINALVAGYAERCGKLDIKFSANLILPEPFPVRDYDMCIVLGNLMENAVEACEKQESNRVAELTVKSQGKQLVIVMRNSFNGRVIQGEGLPVSMKNAGGLGLRSVQAVAARYGGELLTEWDDDTFTAYVTLLTLV